VGPGPLELGARLLAAAAEEAAGAVALVGAAVRAGAGGANGVDGEESSRRCTWMACSVVAGLAAAVGRTGWPRARGVRGLPASIRATAALPALRCNWVTTELGSGSWASGSGVLSALASVIDGETALVSASAGVSEPVGIGVERGRARGSGVRRSGLVASVW
jgi:hypothetical protein